MLFQPINNSISGVEKGDFYCYEIKSSPEDFKSANGHNFIGDFNYYVMTKETYEQVKSNIPYGIGVYVEENGNLTSIRPTRRANRKYPMTVNLLMMFQSSNRENIKNRGTNK